MLSLHSGKWVMSLGCRPAPLTPLLESMMMSSSWNRPLFTSGASGRIAEVE